MERIKDYKSFIGEKMNIAPMTKDRLDRISKGEGLFYVYKDTDGESVYVSDFPLRWDGIDGIGKYRDFNDAVKSISNYDTANTLYSANIANTVMDTFKYDTLDKIYENGIRLFDPKTKDFESAVLPTITDVVGYILKH